MTSAQDAVIDTCEDGHKYAKLPDHPKKDGSSRCPHCMAIGVDRRALWIDRALDYAEKDPDFLSKLRSAVGDA